MFVHDVVEPFAVVCTTEPFRSTSYAVTADPPFDDGADHDTWTLPLPGANESPVGAPGTVRGVALCAEDAAPEPATFSARTENE